MPQLEAGCIIVRAPGTWRAGRPARPVVKASVGVSVQSLLDKEALLDFSMEVSLDGESGEKGAKIWHHPDANRTFSRRACQNFLGQGLVRQPGELK